MASDSPLSPAVAGPHITFGRPGKTSPGGDVAGGGDEIYKKEQTPPPRAVGGDCLLDPSVPVAATEDGDVKITVTTAVAGDGPNVDSGCENGVLPLQPQDTDLAETTPARSSGLLEFSEGFSFSRYLPILRVIPNVEEDRGREMLRRILEGSSSRRLRESRIVDVEEGRLVRETGGLVEDRFHYNFHLNGSGSCLTGGIPLPQPDNEVPGFFDFRLHSGSWINMGGIPVLHPVDVDGGSLVPAGSRSAFGGISVPQHGGRILCVPAGIGLPSDTLVFQTSNEEGGRLLAGSRIGVGQTSITPTNDDFRIIIDARSLETGGDDSHLAPSLERHFRSNCFVILFVTSEILGIVFEIIYQESHIMGYFFFWTVCITIAMYAARLLAMIEGGMANREQFAVYFRGFSFLLLELLQYWGINQGNYVTALKIILRVSGAVISWWVVGVLQTYMDAFGIYLPLRRRDD